MRERVGGWLETKFGQAALPITTAVGAIGGGLLGGLAGSALIGPPGMFIGGAIGAGLGAFGLRKLLFDG